MKANGDTVVMEYCKAASKDIVNTLIETVFINLIASQSNSYLAANFFKYDYLLSLLEDVIRNNQDPFTCSHAIFCYLKLYSSSGSYRKISNFPFEHIMHFVAQRKSPSFEDEVVALWKLCVISKFLINFVLSGCIPVHIEEQTRHLFASKLEELIDILEDGEIPPLTNLIQALYI